MGRFRLEIFDTNNLGIQSSQKIKFHHPTSLTIFVIVKIFKRISILGLVVLFLGLTTGVEIYSVHCNMRGQTFVSLQAGMDPCLTEVAEEETSSCCAAKRHCAANINEKDKNNCCDEEEIHLSYEPDSFSQIKISIPSSFLIDWQPSFYFEADYVFQEEKLLAQFPQPPPLQGRQILEFHCIWRI